MKYYDVYNGDADGICALHQLRLANPVESQRITGVKRDISLLQQVQAQSHIQAGDKVTVLDISLDKNREPLVALLQQQVEVIYFDHHFPGDIPESPNLEVHINTDANVCSSLLVNEYLDGQYLPWAVTAAYGDNLFSAAETAAAPLDLSHDQLETLKLLGTCINYNGYGARLDDLIFHPDDLYQLIHPYAEPFDFMHNEPGYEKLKQGYLDDLQQARNLRAELEDATHALYVLPAEKWARRVSGVYANELAQNYPERAHAMLTHIENDDAYVVSVRAPLSNKTGADELCRQFETGGGRKAAAGINRLPQDEFDRFTSLFKQSFTATS